MYLPPFTIEFQCAYNPSGQDPKPNTSTKQGLAAGQACPHSLLDYWDQSASACIDERWMKVEYECGESQLFHRVVPLIPMRTGSSYQVRWIERTHFYFIGHRAPTGHKIKRRWKRRKAATSLSYRAVAVAVAVVPARPIAIGARFDVADESPWPWPCPCRPLIATSPPKSASRQRD